jgi:hypothetical protein
MTIALAILVCVCALLAALLFLVHRWGSECRDGCRAVKKQRDELQIQLGLRDEELGYYRDENDRLRSEVARANAHHAELHDEVERLRAGTR